MACNTNPGPGSFKKDLHGSRTVVRHARDPFGNFVPDEAVRFWMRRGVSDTIDAQVQANQDAYGAEPTFQGMAMVSAQTSKFSSSKTLTTLQYRRLSGTFGPLSLPPWVIRGEVSFRYQKRFITAATPATLLADGDTAQVDPDTNLPYARTAPLGITQFYLRAAYTGTSALALLEAYAGKVASNAIFGATAGTIKYLGATFYMYKQGSSRQWVLGHHFQHCTDWADYQVLTISGVRRVTKVYPLAADLATIPEVPAGSSDY